MLKAIIYKSSTGHTLEYAKLLSSKLNIPYYTIKEAKSNLKSNDEIIYLGWVCANKICGINKIRNKYKIKCYGAVGAFPKHEDNIKNLKSLNNIKEPLFYMRGGIDFSNLKGFKKFVVKMVGNILEKENKDSQELVDLFKKGKNYVSEENIDEIVQYCK